MGNDYSASVSGSRIVKRSIRIARHRTSVSMEEAFWHELKRLASARRCSLNKLIETIDAERSGNLSSALRLWVLQELKTGHEG
ncbi:MAG: ribbon-helix-helix domain-containing protein [Alphaproteobacteria bacterium]|nr:ribbon-helix-helix domain-containing protein [Alphaproteobacteria bacterium]